MKKLILFVLLLSPLTSQGYGLGESSRLRSYLSFGPKHTCMISNIELKCWGDNGFQQSSFSDGIINTNLKQVATNEKGSCVIEGGDQRQIKCWGLWDNQLYVEQPLIINTLNNPIQMALSLDSGCALGDNRVYCWGAENAALMSQQPKFKQAAYLSMDLYKREICVIDTEGIKCWNAKGTLHKTFTESIANPVRVIQNSKSQLGICALDGKKIKCAGQFNGNKTPIAELFPPATDFALSNSHLCSLNTATQSVYCLEAAQRMDLYNAKKNNLPTEASGILLGDNILCLSEEYETQCWQLSGKEPKILNYDWYDRGGEIPPLYLRNFIDSYAPYSKNNQILRFGHNRSYELVNFYNLNIETIGYDNFFGDNIPYGEIYWAYEKLTDKVTELRYCLHTYTQNTAKECREPEAFKKLYSNVIEPEMGYSVVEIDFRRSVNKICSILKFASLTNFEDTKFKALCYSEDGTVLIQKDFPAGMVLTQMHVSEDQQIFCIASPQDPENLKGSLDLYCSHDNFEEKSNLTLTPFDDILMIANSKTCVFHKANNELICTKTPWDYQIGETNLWTGPAYFRESVGNIHILPDESVCVKFYGTMHGVALLCRGNLHVDTLSHHPSYVNSVPLDAPPFSDLSDYLRKVKQSSSPIKVRFIDSLVQFIDKDLAMLPEHSFNEQLATLWSRDKVFKILKPMITSSTSPNSVKLKEDYDDYANIIQAQYTDVYPADLIPAQQFKALETRLYILKIVIQESLKLVVSEKEKSSLAQSLSKLGLVMAALHSKQLPELTLLTDSLQNNEAILVKLAASPKTEFFYTIYMTVLEEIKSQN